MIVQVRVAEHWRQVGRQECGRRDARLAIATRLGMSRAAATAAIALAAFAAGVPSALGSGIWRDVSIAGRGILEAVDFLAADLFPPVVSIAVVLFVGWALPREDTLSGCGLPPLLARWWLAMVRFVAPMAMLLFLVTLALR